MLVLNDLEQTYNTLVTYFAQFLYTSVKNEKYSVLRYKDKKVSVTISMHNVTKIYIEYLDLKVQHIKFRVNIYFGKNMVFMDRGSISVIIKEVNISIIKDKIVLDLFTVDNY